MSLQVWLPLNKNVIENKGLSDVVFTNSNPSGITFVDSGIESCYSFSGYTEWGICYALWQESACKEFMDKYINHHSFSLSSWFKTSANETMTLCLTYGLRLLVGASHYTCIDLYNSSGHCYCNANVAVNDNKWHHICGTYNISDNKIRIYIDGILKNTINYTSGQTYASSWNNGIYVGKDPNSNTTQTSQFYFQGSLSDIRIYDHALSDKEVYELAKGLSLHLKLDNIDVYDVTGYGWDITKASSAALAVISKTPRYAKSMKGNGPILGLLAINKPFTLAFWVKPPVDGASNSGTIFDIGPIRFYKDHDGVDKFTFAIYNDNTTKYLSPLVNAQNEWYHLVLTISDSIVKLYINGIYHNQYNIIVKDGLDMLSLFQNLNALMSDFRLYRTALTDELVYELYHTAGSIDNHGNAHCYELNECEDDKLKFEAATASTISLASLSSHLTVEYSKDDITYLPMDTATVIHLQPGETAYVRGILNGNNTQNDYTLFSMTGEIYSYGNIMYLADYTNINTTNTYAYGFANLFKNCTSLITAPELPAKVLPAHYYEYMFSGCTNLSEAPKLPAITLSASCYEGMFRSSGLIFTPELPATELANSCYRNMFRECSSLIYPGILPAINLNNAARCYYGMYAQCTSLATAPELPATTLSSECYNYMFGGCTSLTSAPELKADVLVNACYNNMFAGCTSLNYIKCLATDISAANCTTNWVNNVASTGTFIEDNEGVAWTIGINGIPENWEVETNLQAITFRSTGNSTLGLNRKSSYQTVQYSSDGETWNNMTTSTNIPLSDGQQIYVRGKLTNDNTSSNYTQFKMSGSLECNGNINYLWDYENPDVPLKQYCGYNLFAYCSALAKAPKLPATTLAISCYLLMFRSCTSLTSAPELPATTLAGLCYYYMFLNCSNLTSVPYKLPAMTLANLCYQGMFYGCTRLVESPILPAPTLVTYCYYEMFAYCPAIRRITCLATNVPYSNCADGWMSGTSDICTFVKDPSMNSWTIGWSGPIYNYWDIENYYENPDVEFVTDTTFANENAVKLEVKEDNSIIKVGLLGSKQSLYLSKDKTNWMTLRDGNRITVLNGETYYMCGMLTGANTGRDYTNIRLLGKIDASGNINTIWNYSDPSANLYNYCGRRLFSLSTGLDNVGLTLPASKVGTYAYWQMFYYCTRLTVAPELPATTLGGSCYYLMFTYCSSLVLTPSILPALTLTTYCYTDLFTGCTSLVTVPVGLLPAMTVLEASYASMFVGCTSLTNAPSLPAMSFNNTRQYASMFKGCTSLTTAPELPALTLVNLTYARMFEGCTNLTYIKCLATDISASNSVQEWTSGVSSTGTFVKNSTMTSWPRGTSGIPTNWTIQDA